ncbi:extracellular catalytic domain type 2 short-chain-length polyhydroxyalkanoate depolymerase [Pseudoduganella violacea]|uniref:Poly(3-hydroxybutyrate) depolymerase n=1 Tax=Pseudoduganella violacea TaxID=1715466 RepID=A0A7W5BG01_9BURK|nr:PHB depolymerase family esterase [Pseudoduganella violacea]MBB3121575.1 poly(3-hydroxybutyrate) depolymerase [Pseudoduganella violacea]
MTQLSTHRHPRLLILPGLFLTLALASVPAQAAPLPALAAYGADPGQTSVSGMSSGAFMAAQFSVAFSATVVGAGIVAGGPFYCAGLFAPTLPAQAASSVCMAPVGSGPRASAALNFASAFAEKGQIDSLSGLARQKIYIFSGTKDQVVKQKVVDQTAKFFALAGVKAANLKYVNNIAAGHALLTDSPANNACGTTAAPFINNCGYQQAREILKWIYGPLQEAGDRPAGQLSMFDQAPFDPAGKATLGPIGYVYVPDACEKAACRIHVAFHGCLQGERTLGDRYARTTGYNETAAGNRIIVLYPQIAASSRNPLGCWDFWGYTAPDDTVHPDFYSKQAPQHAAIASMLKRLSEARPSPDQTTEPRR